MQIVFIFKYADGTRESLTHDYLFSLDPEAKRILLRPLRKLYRLGELKVLCSCNQPHPQMILNHRSKPADSFYISSKDKDEHSDQCYYKRGDGDFTLSNSIYEKGFVKNDDGKYEINFDTQDFQLEENFKNNQKKSNAVPPINMTVTNNYSGTSTNKPSIYATMLRLITEAWNDIIKHSYYQGVSYPKNDKTTLFNRLTNHTTKKYTHKNISVHELLYKGEAEGKIYIIAKKHNFKSAAFTMLLLDDKGFQKEGENYRLSLRNPNNNNHRQIDVSAAMFDKAKAAIINMPGPYFAGGFVENTGFEKTPRFISFGLVAVNDYGSPVESSYERQLYNQLCDEKRAVVKQLTSDVPEWKGFLPDGLLLDTKPRTIIEVFGMSIDNESYHVQRAIKIEHFSSLKPIFDFWYWDAFKQKKIPPLP